MKFSNYFEARRETKELVKKGVIFIPRRLYDYEELKKYKGKKGYFISFRSIDKIGINPQSRYNTPNGIYAYPLDYILKYSEQNRPDKHEKPKQTKAPFADENPYIYVFKAKKKANGIKDLYHYSSLDFDNDVEKLKKEFKNIDFNELINDSRENALIKNPGGIMWRLVYTLSKKNPVKWNKIFRNVLGYDYIIDEKGQGIIHSSEPTQAVFFTVTALEVVDKIVTNSFRKEVYNTKKEIHTWEDGEKKILIKGNWKNGVWKDGVFEDGTWNSGTWENGKMKKSYWKNGLWKNGEAYDVNWETGTWENGWWDGGTFIQGVWKNGEWKQGFFLKGIWENGKWWEGKWVGGTWKNGTWMDGAWNGGEWVDGVWKKGWIYDPDKKGNYKDDWQWRGSYVQSPISPKEYFKK